MYLLGVSEDGTLLDQLTLALKKQVEQKQVLMKSQVPLCEMTYVLREVGLVCSSVQGKRDANL